MVGGGGAGVFIFIIRPQQALAAIQDEAKKGAFSNPMLDADGGDDEDEDNDEENPEDSSD